MQPGSETREPTIADLMTELRALRDDNAALRGRLEAVEARETNRIETTRPSASPSPSAIDDQVSRRRLLRRTGTAVAGIAGAVALGSLAQPMPARAGIPNYLSLGSLSNASTGPTSLAAVQAASPLTWGLAVTLAAVGGEPSRRAAGFVFTTIAELEPHAEHAFAWVEAHRPSTTSPRTG